MMMITMKRMMKMKVYDFRNPNYLVPSPTGGITSPRAPKVIQNQCMHCAQHNQILVDLADYVKWSGGELIHEAFPWLNPTEREILKTGIHGKCWDEIFPYTD